MANRVFDLYWEKRYGEALDFVEDARSDHPHQDGRLTFWQACLLGISGRSPEAIDVLEGGLERGLWWAPDLLTDSDLDSVRSLPGWEGMERRCSDADGAVHGRSPPSSAGPPRPG